jgi:exopolysaccharide biosynthesis polyprenyl glycosylphosphotransferase
MSSVARGRALRIAASAAVAAIALYFLAANLRWAELRAAFSTAHPEWVLAAIGTTILTVALVTVRWRSLLGRTADRTSDRVSWRSLWDAVVIGQAVNILLPLRFGEGARVAVTCADTGRPAGAVTVAMAIERALDVAAFGAMVLLLAAAGQMPRAFDRALPAIAALAAGTILTVLLFVRLMPVLLEWTRRRLRSDTKPARWLAVQEASARIAWIDLADRRRLLVLTILTALSLLSSAATNLLTFRAFDLGVPAIAALVLLAVLQVGTAVVSVPGNVGVFHYLTVITLAAWGIPAALALATAIILHLVSLGTRVGLGALSVALRGVGPRKATRPLHPRDAACSTYPVPQPLRSSERHAALFVGDAAALTMAVLLALWTWSLTAGFPLNVAFVRAHAIWFASVPLWLIVLIPTRRRSALLDMSESGRGIARATGALLLVYFAAFFFAGSARLPRLVALYLLWDGTLLLIGWRVVAQWSLTRAVFTRRVLIVGSGAPLEVARRLLESPGSRDAELVHVVDVTAGGLQPLDKVSADLSVTDLIVAMEGEVGDRWVQQLLKCQERGTHVVRVTQLYEETLGRVPVAHVEPSWLVTNFFDVARFRDTSPAAKRLFDLAVGGMLAIVALALLPFVALAALAEGGGPIFYQQRRVGRGGREFTLVKFRTMRVDAEKDGAARWSPPGDSRVTRVGRFLRRTRIDELPNVLAILRGDMSVVGPRPERPEFVDQLERDVPFYRARLIVRPGLTGWAQVNVPYGDSVGDATIKLEYDLYYIKHQSLWFDMLIVFRTAGTILRLAGR